MVISLDKSNSSGKISYSSSQANIDYQGVSEVPAKEHKISSGEISQTNVEYQGLFSFFLKWT